MNASPRSAGGAEPLPQIEPADALPILTKHETQQAIDRYATLTRLRPRVGTNLHQDAEFARRTLFGGTANAGVATLAYCAELLERAYGPEALLRSEAQVAQALARAMALGGRRV